jgi:hypothetical protein
MNGTPPSASEIDHEQGAGRRVAARGAALERQHGAEAGGQRADEADLERPQQVLPGRPEEHHHGGGAQR